MIRIARYMTVVFFAVLAIAAPGFAATAEKLHVTATVLPFVFFNSIQNVATYQVRSDDIKRGYVDIPNAVTVTLRTNVTRGITVIVDNRGSGRILLKENRSGDFMGNSINLSTDGHRAGELISRSFDSRIILPADAQEGVYPLSVAPMSFLE